MAKPIRVPKTTSSPAEPSAPSLLTTIPPELRNAVYEVLFRRDEAVLLHNAKEYHLKHPIRSEFGSHEEHRAGLIRYDKAFTKDMQEGQGFKHDFGCGLSMLLSCRQIYHECVGVLYGSNIFVISRALHRHDHNNDGRFKHKQQYIQLKYTPLWLVGLGCQIDLLNKVHIDADAVCPNDCHLVRSMYFDMLPIMRIIWKHPQLGKNLKFIRTGRKIEGHAEPTDPREANKHSEQRVIVLNNLLESLCTQDILRLKQYMRFENHLRHVWVRTLPEQCSASATGVQFSNILIVKWYHVAKCGRELTASEQKPDCGIMALLSNRLLAEKIIGYAADGQPGLVFDLTQRTFCGLNLTLLYLDGMLGTHCHLNDIFARATDVTLRARSTSEESNFDNFTALKELENDPRFSPFILAYREGSPRLTIDLEFNISKKSSLPELKINIEKLVRLLSQMPNTILRISLNCIRDQHVYNEGITVDIVCLCLSIYLLLSDLLESWSIPLLRRLTASITELVIDGRGILKSATCCTDDGLHESEIENKFAHLSKEEMYHYGYRTAADRERDCDYLEEQGLWPHHGKAFGCLLDLRAQYWADWEVVRPLSTTS